MAAIKIALKWISCFLAIPFTYLLFSLILSVITIERSDKNCENNKIVFLSTNGVHLNIVIPKNSIDANLLKDLHSMENEKYISFGWGDEIFYINTPTWRDITLINALHALFLKSTTLMHVTHYKDKRKDWVAVSLSTSELDKLNHYILKTFKKDANGNKLILTGAGYSSNNNFYKANGSYSLFKTSNTWVNSTFKKSGLKSCLWTPFDFLLINKYK